MFGRNQHVTVPFSQTNGDHSSIGCQFSVCHLVSPSTVAVCLCCLLGSLLVFSVPSAGAVCLSRLLVFSVCAVSWSCLSVLSVYAFCWSSLCCPSVSSASSVSSALSAGPVWAVCWSSLYHLLYLPVWAVS